MPKVRSALRCSSRLPRPTRRITAVRYRLAAFSQVGLTLLLLADDEDPEVVRDVLDGVRYRRVDSAWMLVAFFNSLETWLVEHPKVRFDADFSFSYSPLTRYLSPAGRPHPRRLAHGTLPPSPRRSDADSTRRCDSDLALERLR